MQGGAILHAVVRKEADGEKTPAERKQDLEREAAQQGFEPLTRESLAALALGTPEEGRDLLDVSSQVRRESRARRRAE